MSRQRWAILIIGAVQVMAGFALGTDILVLPPSIRFSIALLNVGLVYALANMRSWWDLS